MTEQEFYTLIHRRLAQVAIGASAIRNQGAAGLVNILREYFERNIQLTDFFNAFKSDEIYRHFLDCHTDNILLQFPQSAQSWGAARKGLNLFLREVIYSRFFAHKFDIPENFSHFNNFIKAMEVPLDREVANGLIRDGDGTLPKWKNIKSLDSSINQLFQEQALVIAIGENIARVNLDLKYWRSAQ
jgi:hypothetical protein